VGLLTSHWSLDPVVVLLGITAVLHATGLSRRLRGVRAAGRGAPQASGWRLRAAAFYLGLLLTAGAIASPLDYWADDYLFAHMIQHIVLAFFAPALIVLGAPWLALQRGLPRPLRRDVGHLAQRVRRAAWSRRLGRVISDPRLTFLAFNVNMVVWHLPGPFDLAERTAAVHIWAEHAGFLVLGVLLWLQILESPPLRSRLSPLYRAATAFGTNAVMVGVAMTLVLFTHRLYPVYAHVPHALLGQAADQQVAGSALWICGEFTLAPAIYWNVLAFLREQDQRPRLAVIAPWTRRAGAWGTVSATEAEMGWRARSAVVRLLSGWRSPGARRAVPAARAGPPGKPP
jgi:cytochrome c oxidase assembly factor CtaG